MVAGGDGSLNWVANTIIKQKLSTPPLAVLPWGTSNDFSYQLVGKFSMEKMLHALKEGKTRSVDVGCLNNSFFLNVAGAGLLVDVAHKTSSDLKQRLGMLAYYIEGARNLPAYKPFTMNIKKEGKREEIEVFLFLILNSKGAGGLYNLAPHALPDDGKFDILIIKNTGLPGLITLLPQLLKGTHISNPRINYFQAERFEIEGPSELDTDIDGESGPPLPLSFRVLPRRLQFIVV
ncbi:MAG: diacylglycerol kinase family lipid kinase [Bacillota bacterium]|nr:diacylglycerol kinase family lipid kinase [Bacillota bacterium]